MSAWAVVAIALLLGVFLAEELALLLEHALARRKGGAPRKTTVTDSASRKGPASPGSRRE